MRKTLAVLLALFTLTFVAGCGTSGGDDSADTTAVAEKSTTTATEQETTTTEEETTTTEASGDAVAVADWADDFCGNFGTWITAIQKAGNDVGTDVTPGDVDGVKASIVDLFATASDETATLISSLEDDGIPDMDDGEALVEDLIGKFTDFKTAIDTAQGDASDLDTSDAAAFQTAVTGLVSTFQKETTTVGNSFGELDTKYPSPELQSALSSCDAF